MSTPKVGNTKSYIFNKECNLRLQQNPAAKKRVIVGVAVVGECGRSAGRAHRVGNTPPLPRPLQRDAPSSRDMELRNFYLKRRSENTGL